MDNKQREIRNYVGGKINTLKNLNESNARAALAKLRRGVGKHPGNVPDIWEFTLGNLPEVFLSKSSEPTPGEWAVHMSLTLFALHQQGKDPKQSPMSDSTPESSISLGGAVQALVHRKGEVSKDAIKRRFDTVVTSNSPEELSHHLRGIIQLLRDESIKLDYPRLAEDLFSFQSTATRDGVRLRWGQDYYEIKRKDEEIDEE